MTVKPQGSKPTMHKLVWEQTYSDGEKESHRVQIDDSVLRVLTHPFYISKKLVASCGTLFTYAPLKSDNMEDAKKEAIAFLKKQKRAIAAMP